MSDLEQLRAFAQAVMESWPEGDVDGGHLQDIAEKHGLITPLNVTEPCSETGCMCKEMDNLPGICYRKTQLLTGGPSGHPGTK